MGSEGLSHRFAAQDPTFKENSSSSKDTGKKSSPQHSMCHTSGTQPVSISNGPQSSPSSSLIKHKQKSNPKYTKLFKLYRRQLSHIETSLNAIESLSKSANSDKNQILLSNRKCIDQLNENLEKLYNSPSEHDHIHFDQIKHDIEQLINDLKSYKMNNDDPDSTNTIDHLVGYPLDVSDSEEDGKITLMYF
jgi:hypothetical protein